MMYYTKESVKLNNKIRLAKYDMLYLVCFVYIFIFGLNIFSYFTQSDVPEVSFINYSAAMTGMLCLFLAIILPFILSWQNKKYIKIYKSEMNKPGEKLYYNQ